MDLVCPAGSLPALKIAIDNGADCVYMGFRDDTNARNFPGLNFDLAAAREGVRYAHERKRQVFLALNTFPQLAGWERAQRAVDRAAELEVDAVIVADAGIMEYAAARHPQLRLHLSVQGSATYYAIEEPASLNTLELLPDLLDAGVAAVKIEGRQRSPAYVAQVTRTWRDAIDACRANPARFTVKPAWTAALRKISEGQQQTLGAYHRPWK